MAEQQKRNAGENALQRAVRLLGKLEKELSHEGMGDTVAMEIGVGGSGRITYLSALMSVSLFEFISVEELLVYLEADRVGQLLMTLASGEQQGERG